MSGEPIRTERHTSAADAPPRSSETSSRLLTIPNVISGIRLVGTGGLVVLALAGNARAFAVLFLALAATDWIDGRLARWLDQRSDWGARLDSVADALMFAALIFGCMLLKSEQFLANRDWLAAVILSYTLSCAAGLWKFGRMPAYHTWAAKISWHLIMIAMLFLFFDWSVWPLRIALTAVTLANLEAALITCTLDERRSDVRSLAAARRIRAEGES
jgi:cardiolipin synthase (CMP-forming)